MKEPLLKAKGGDGASEDIDSGRERSLRHERDRIRNECRRKLEECARDSNTAMNMVDVETFYDNLLSEKGLADAPSEEDKNKWIRQNSAESIPKFIKDAREAGMKALRIIDDSEKQGFISRESANEWRSRLKKGNDWKEREKFIEETLPEYQKNWKKLNEELKDLRAKQKKLGVTEKEIPALKAINAGSFKSKKFGEKKQLLDQAIAAFIAYEKDKKNLSPEKKMKQLYDKAKNSLQAAVQKGVLSPRKVGTWMRRIFEENDDPVKIEDFLNGKGNNPLSSLVEQWTKARQHFDAIENKRKAIGTPRSFHFVHKDVFLDWHFDQRMAYVEEADRRFESIDKEPELFLKLRHELDAKDWDSAEELMKEAEGKNWSKEDQEKLQSMKNFFKTHKKVHVTVPEKQETPTDVEIVQEMRDIVSTYPIPYQKLYTESMRRGYKFFWVLTTIDYNRCWCWNHGFLDEKKEMKMRTEAEVMTQHRIDHGHSNDHEANSAMGKYAKQAPAIRDQKGLRKSQAILTNGDESKDNILRSIEEQGDMRDFWYNSNRIDVNVKYPDHKEIVMKKNPRLKQLMREAEKRNIIFTRTGPVEKKNQPIIQGKDKNTKLQGKKG